MVRHWSFYSLSVGVLILTFLIASGKVIDRIDNVYESSHHDSFSDTSIRFSEVSKMTGVTYENKKIPLTDDQDNLSKSNYEKNDRQFFEDIKNQELPIGRNTGEFAYSFEHDPFPSVSIVDINSDGFLDVYFTQNKGKENELYINQKGVSFSNETYRYNLTGYNENESSSSSVFYDFNQDGFIDVLIVKWGCHKLFYGQGANKPFLNKSELLGGYCSFARMANLIDFDKDGDMDVVFANYSEAMSSQSTLKNNSGFFVGNKIHGGENNILENLNSHFKVHSINFNGWKSSTHAVSVGDYNNDSWPDILFTNDYSSDELWINNAGKNFIDKTDFYLSPYSLHGYSGMNGEMADIDGDGIEEIYITNAYKPPYQATQNNLWKRDSADTGFYRASEKYNVGRCGFSWGAKAVDIENNGTLDMFVVNGRSTSSEKSLKRNGWFDFIEIRSMPLVLRRFSQKLKEHDFTFRTHAEKSCLFLNTNNGFIDIATQVGITDENDGRGLALVDFDNDGRMDFVVANLHQPSNFYRNTSTANEKRNWIGFDVNYKKNIHWGARVVVKYTNGTTAVRNIQPLNGYKGQSDPRVHVGIGENTIKSIMIYGSDDKPTMVSNFMMNQYNKVTVQ